MGYSEEFSFAIGWIRDYPDYRDYTIDNDVVSDRLKELGEKETVRSMLAQTGAISAKSSSLPSKVDLSDWCSPIEDQGRLGSCTAHAAIGLVEYFEKKAFDKHLDASRLFLYKVTRNMLHFTGDTGAYLRSTMGTLVIFGVPPEEYYLMPGEPPQKAP